MNAEKIPYRNDVGRITRDGLLSASIALTLYILSAAYTLTTRIVILEETKASTLILNQQLREMEREFELRMTNNEIKGEITLTILNNQTAIMERLSDDVKNIRNDLRGK